MNDSSVDIYEYVKTCHKIPALLPSWTRCGKANCRCNDGYRHGPYWVLRWRDGPINRRRYVRQDDVAAVEAVITRRRATDRARRQHAALAVTDLRRIRNLVRDIEGRTPE